ncbi:MAG: DJ-1/PfpI family protein [Candidatus Nanohaloarchaea archaeon]
MKVLFVLTEQGYWAEECIEPLKMISERHEVELATPTGSRPEPDAASVEGYREFIEDSGHLQDPSSLMEAYRDQDEYDALVLPGGHGTLWDINQDRHVQELLVSKVDDAGALVICHAVGVLGFLPELVDGREVTGFPDEWETDQVDGDEVREGRKLPYRVEAIVKSAGAVWRSNLSQDTSVVRDGNLVTARGPDSSSEAAREFLELLDDRES